jgi:hypothetical protein
MLRVGLTCLQRLTFVPALGLIIIAEPLLGRSARAANKMAAPEVRQEDPLQVDEKA